MNLHRRPAGSWVAALFLLAAASARAASGGPDGDGYTWRDSAEPGVIYAWEDISATGIDLVTASQDDRNFGFQPLSFPFPYYSGAYSQVACTSNGWASLVDGTSTTYNNEVLPQGGIPTGILAAWWDDLYVTLGTSHVWFQDLGTHAVITWDNVHQLGTVTDLYTFQLVLYPDGRIAMQYANMVGPVIDGTIGIESPDQVNGLTVVSDPPGGIPTSGYRVEFQPPTPAPRNLDCASAVLLSCGTRVAGNNATGVALQPTYRCSRNDYSGRELVYQMDFAAPTSVRLLLTPTSGNPDLVVVSACDPNICVAPPGDRVLLNNVTGTYYVVVDSAPGQEGAFDLRVDCNPMAPRLDCAGAAFLSCNTTVSGNLSLGAALQDGYWCTDTDYGGREQVWAIDFATPTDARFLLTATSGNPDVILLSSCDPAACVGLPGDAASVTGATGTYYVVIDCPPGQEGSYDLRIDCNPVPVNVDCANGTYVSCGDTVTGDLAAGQANQDIYWCTTALYDGNEQVYIIDVAAAARLGVTLTAVTGDPDLFVIGTCDPSNCSMADDGTIVLDVLPGTYYIVVDSQAGQEGEYELQVDCLTDNLSFCSDGVLETDPWGTANGTWLVNGWLYHPGDTHNIALRVDGTTTYDTDGFACLPFTTVASGVRGLTGPAFAQWDAPEGTIRQEFTETSSGGCCGLLVAMTVTNTDIVPHYYEFRMYHDTAFGVGDGGNCGVGNVIDGGPIECNGTRYESEVNLLAIGGDTCLGQIQNFSADHPSELRSSFEMLAPNTPSSMEWLDWNDGGAPCTTWNDLYTPPVSMAGCSDTSLLFIWRFPQTAGMLLPGQSARAAYRIGLRCAFPCNIVCESPTMTTADATDIGPCNDGIGLTWAAATFPGTGSGVYHVYRSTISAADALTRPPISGGGVAGTTYQDGTTAPGQTYYYVIQAEALDFPNCGIGPLVNGSTVEIEPTPQPITDNADTVGPLVGVGDALRALGHTTDTVNFLWPTAPPPGLGEHYVILRSDDDPQGPFTVQGTSPIPSWTDPAAPPTYVPAHIWYYDVRIADDCGNVSLD